MLKTIYSCFIFLFTINTLLSEEVSIRAFFDPAYVSKGESSQYCISVAGDRRVKEINLPKVPNLRIICSGRSQALQIINGVNHSETIFTYTVTSTKEGIYTIPSFKIQVANTWYDVPESILTIKETQKESMLDKIAVCLELNISKKEVYLNEVIPVSIKLRAPAGLKGRILPPGKPLLIGQDFLDNGVVSSPSQVYIEKEGMDLQEITWDGTIIPIKTGNLMINYELIMALNVAMAQDKKSGFNDPFGQMLQFLTVQEKEIFLNTDTQSICVLDLPKKKQPIDFSGYIGDFIIQPIQTSIMDPEVGDPVTITFSISGSGNIEKIKAPILKKNKAFKVYSPKEKTIIKDEKKYHGAKVFEYIIIPQEEGKLVIDDLYINWFNPDTKTYNEVRCPIPSLLVKPISHIDLDYIEDQSPFISEPFEKEKGIQPICLELGGLMPSLNWSIYHSMNAVCLHIVIFIIIMVWIILRFKQIKYIKNQEENKFNAKIKELLKQSHMALQKQDTHLFFSYASNALEYIVKVKTGEPLSLSILQNLLLSKDYDKDNKEGIAYFWNLREAFLFGGVSLSREEIKKAYAILENYITLLN